MLLEFYEKNSCMRVSIAAGIELLSLSVRIQKSYNSASWFFINSS